MAAGSGFLLLTVVVAGVFAQASSANIFIECLNFLRCNSKAPVCGTNGTHCWLAASECERTKFNCLQLQQTDFDKVSGDYCRDYVVGGIAPCCIRQSCGSKKEPTCGKEITRKLTVCKWFNSTCDLANENCGTDHSFVEVSKELCNFGFDSPEQYCAGDNNLERS